MKGLTLLVFALASSFSQGSAQGYKYLSVQEGLVTYERVEQLDTMRAPYIFSKSKEFIIEKFSGPVDKIQGESKPSILKAFVFLTYDVDKYTAELTIKIKDGAVKVTITHYMIQLTSGVTSLDGKSQLPLEGQFVDINKAFAKQKKSLTAAENAGNSLTESLVKYIKSSGF